MNWAENLKLSRVALFNRAKFPCMAELSWLYDQTELSCTWEAIPSPSRFLNVWRQSNWGLYQLNFLKIDLSRWTSISQDTMSNRNHHQTLHTWTWSWWFYWAKLHDREREEQGNEVYWAKLHDREKEEQTKKEKRRGTKWWRFFVWTYALFFLLIVGPPYIGAE